MGRFIDITGQRFGQLTVIRRAEAPSPYHTYPGAWWLCRCDCGAEHVVQRNNLITGNTRSCGSPQCKKRSKK